MPYLYECKMCGFSKQYKTKHLRHVCAKQHEDSKKHKQMLELLNVKNENTQETPQETPKQTTQQPPQETPQQPPQETSKETPKQSTQETPQETPKQSSKEAPKEIPKTNRLKRMLKNMLELCISMFDVVKEMNPTHPQLMKKTPAFLYLVDEYKDLVGINNNINSKLQEIDELKRRRREQEEERRKEVEKLKKALADAERKYEEIKQPINEIVELQTITAPAEDKDIESEYVELQRRYNDYLSCVKRKIEFSINLDYSKPMTNELEKKAKEIDNEHDYKLTRIKTLLNLLKDEDPNNWLEKSKTILVNIEKEVGYIEPTDNTAFGLLMKSISVV